MAAQPPDDTSDCEAAGTNREQERRALLEGRHLERSSDGSHPAVLGTPRVARVGQRRASEERVSACTPLARTVLGSVASLLAWVALASLWRSSYTSAAATGAEFEAANGDAAGLLRSSAQPSGCLGIQSDSSFVYRVEKVPPVLSLADCEVGSSVTEQRWELTKAGHLRNIFSDMCAAVMHVSGLTMLLEHGQGALAVLEDCGAGNAGARQRWILEASGLLRHVGTGDCLGPGSLPGRLHLAKCESSSSADDALLLWEWVPRSVDTDAWGFVENSETNQCLEWSSGHVAVADCRFHERRVGQRWRQMAGGVVTNLASGDCLAAIDSDLTVSGCTSDAPRNREVWNWDAQGSISSLSESTCIDIVTTTKHPTVCGSHGVVLSICNPVGAESFQRWHFVPLSRVSPPPLGSPSGVLPVVVVSYGRRVDAVLVRAGYTCRSDFTTDLGNQKTLQECMMQVHWMRRSSPSYWSPEDAEPVAFNYGVFGDDRGRCLAVPPFHGQDPSQCLSGWVEGPFNSYRLEAFLGEVGPLPYEVGLAQMATRTYARLPEGSNVAGWTVKKQCDKRRGHAQDLMTLFRRGNRCVIAFAGTDDVKDGIADLEVATKEVCGASFHAGFVGELLDFLHTDCWIQDIAPLAASEQCEGGRIAVGHSMGGAIAEALAYCANRASKASDGLQETGGLRELQPDAPTFTVSEVYTWGAPGIAKQPLTNDLAEDGCFAGARFINIDAQMLDGIPWITSVVHFVHPRTVDVLLFEDHFGYVAKETLACGSLRNEALPKTDFQCRPTVIDHSMNKYMYRLEQLLGPFANGTAAA